MKNAPRRWEAIVHEDGTGLICTSGTEMLGRKLFVWGQSQGGYHWQDFLLQEGATHYCEIQSGLAPTQMGCVPIAGESEIHWCEAFGSIALDPETAHGDWHNAVRAAGDLLEKMLPHIVNCHLHDNNGAQDEHKLPGDGCVDWSHVMPLLRQAPRLQLLQSEVVTARHGISTGKLLERFNKLYSNEL